jgi:hypothetical protein
VSRFARFARDRPKAGFGLDTPPRRAAQNAANGEWRGLNGAS